MAKSQDDGMDRVIYTGTALFFCEYYILKQNYWLVITRRLIEYTFFNF